MIHFSHGCSLASEKHFPIFRVPGTAISSILDFVHGLFGGVGCAGLWEEIWLAVLGIPVLSKKKKCLLFICKSFIYVLCRVS